MTATDAAEQAGHARLDEAVVDKAFRELDLAALVAQVDAAVGGAHGEGTRGEDGEGDEAVGPAIVSMALRASSLILPRADKARQKRRDRFLDGLARHLEQRFGTPIAEAFADARQQLSIAEDGYRRILTTLAQTAFAQLPPSTRAAAVLARAVHEFRQIHAGLHDLYDQGRYPALQSLSFRDEAGRPVSPDVLIESEVGVAGASLIMDAIGQGWLDGEVVVLPDLPAVDEAQWRQAGRNAYTASAWRAWRRTEERARFLGGRLAVRTGEDLPNEAGAEVERAYVLEGGQSHWLDWAAQMRLRDGWTQSLVSLMAIKAFEDRVCDIDGAVAPAPTAWVSLAEPYAIALISEALGYPVLEDPARIDGLRIVEWLRGMAVLSRLVERRKDRPDRAGDPLLPVFSQPDLIGSLMAVGLLEGQAETLIDQLTFRKTSLDLFDAPILRLADGRRMLFGPALDGQNHANVLLSIFAHKDVVFEGKGTAFETRVLKLLADRGLQVRAIDVRRERQQYEFDAVLAWGEHVFLFECKNRSLPGDRPLPAWRFARELRRQARQTLRLKRALETWPDIFEEAFGFSLAGRTIVPCVLNNLPYGRVGEHEGVYFYEYSALGRFFASRCLNVKTFNDYGPPRGRVETAIEVLPIWAGPAPTDHDLMREIQNSFQLRVLAHHSRQTTLTFHLDETTLAVCQEFVREDVTPFTLAKMAGVSPRAVRLAMDRAERRAKKSRRRQGGDKPRSA